MSSLRSVADSTKRALKTIKETGFTPAKKGDSFLLKRTHSMTMLSGGTTTYDRYYVYKVDSVTREGAIKRASQPYLAGKDSLPRTTLTFPHDCPTWIIPAWTCADIDRLCVEFLGLGTIDDFTEARRHVSRILGNINREAGWPGLHSPDRRTSRHAKNT